MSEILGQLRSKFFKPDSFLRNLSIVMTGTALAQVLNFVLMPVVSRLFSPADFGVFGTFSSILAVVAAGITLQYSQAIVLPKSDSEATNVFFVSMMSVLSICMFLLVISGILGEHLLQFASLPSYQYVLLLVLASFVAGTNQTLQAWCIRSKEFKHTSFSQIIRAVSAATIWVAAGFMNLGAIGLVVGAILADIAASLNLSRVFMSNFKEIHRKVSKEKMKKIAGEFKDFPFFAAPQNLMNALSQGLPVLFLGYFYGLEFAGFYAFGLRILHAPMKIILSPLRQVLFQKATETYNQSGDLLRLYYRTTLGLAFLGLLPSLFIFVWAPQVFVFVFGEEWLVAGVYARWLILLVFVGFINPPSTIIVRILRKQKHLFCLECIILFSRILVLVLGGMYLEVESTIILFSILGFFLNMLIVIGVWVSLKMSSWSLHKKQIE